MKEFVQQDKKDNKKTSAPKIEIQNKIEVEDVEKSPELKALQANAAKPELKYKFDRHCLHK